MAHAKGVIFAFAAFGKATQAFVLAVAGKNITATGEYFMAISLMAYVPYQLVVRRIVYVMQCHRQFYYAKAGAKVAAVYTYHVNNVLPQFIAHLMQLLTAQFFQIGRAVYLFE